MGRIYVPMTGSAESRKAISRAISLAKTLNMDVVAINVIDKELLNKMERYKIFIEEETEIIKEGMKKDAEKYLNYAQKLGNENGVNVNTVLLEGDPYSKIMDYIKHDNKQYKIVCIAKKCGGEFLKDIFSTIERKILLNISCDVIVVGECL